MSQHLPDHFEPWRFSDLGKRISGTYALAEMPRLLGCLADSQGEAEFVLEFYRDPQGRACLRGSLTATLRLLCQRCLEAMEWPVESTLSAAFVETLGEAERLPESLDPVLVEQGRVGLKELLEDELLLALPQVPRHLPAECGVRLDLVDTAGDATVQARENPFAVLAGLKRQDP